MTDEMYGLKINLANLYGVDVIDYEVDGIVEPAVVIPMRLNGIYLRRSKNNRALNIYGKCLPKRQLDFGATHFVTLSRPPEIAKIMKEKGFEHPYPIIGNLTLVERRFKRPSSVTFDNLDNVLK